MNALSAEEIANKENGRRVGPDSWNITCPVPSHGKGQGDKNPSCTITQKENGKLLLHCHGGCSQEEVLQAAREKGWFGKYQNKQITSEKKPPFEVVSNDKSSSGTIRQLKQKGYKIAAVYDYLNVNSKLEYQNVRLELYGPAGNRIEKTFRQRRRDESGQWIGSLKGIESLPYNLPQILNRTEDPIWLVEGEKDANRLKNLGQLATSVANWNPKSASYFKQRDVYVIPDNDQAGIKKLKKTISELKKSVRTLKIVRPPILNENLKLGWDVSDYLDSDGTLNELQEIAKTSQNIANSIKSLSPIWVKDLGDISTISWLIKGLIARGDLGLIFGASGTGKSFLAVDIATHIAIGRDWNGYKVVPSGVLYIGLEGARGLEKRFIAQKLKYKEEFSEDGGAVPIAVWSANLDLCNDRSDTNLLIREVEKKFGESDPPISLIVIDTLARAMASGDENSSEDMGKLLSNVAHIQEETGAHVMLIHHHGKDTNRGPRGHSSLFAAVDTAFEVTRNKSQNVSFVNLAKQKDEEDGVEFAFELLTIELGKDEDDDAITTCILAPSDDTKTTKKWTPTGQAKDALEILINVLKVNGSQLSKSSDRIKGNPVVVTIDRWREECFRENLTGKNDNRGTFNQAFSRANKKLKSQNLIDTYDGWVWLTDPPVDLLLTAPDKHPDVSALNNNDNSINEDMSATCHDNIETTNDDMSPTCRYDKNTNDDKSQTCPPKDKRQT